MRVLLLLALCAYNLFGNAHIFVYHRFGDVRYPTTNTTLEELRTHFEYLKTNNYTVVPLQDIINKIYKKEPIPDNWVAITIDDSFKSVNNALPLFKEYNYPFTLFVYVGATEGNYGDFMSWEQLKAIEPYGDLQLHSYGHAHMTRESKEDIIQETQKAITLFEKHLHKTPTMYAYPFGEYDSKVQEALSQFNFKAIFNQNNGSVNHTSNPLDINRVALVGPVNIKIKLRYNTLDVNWQEPKVFPEDGILKKVRATVDPKIKKAKLFVSGHGWQDINVNNGIIDADLNMKLKNNRTRVILGTDVFTISNRLIIKHK